MHIRCLLKWLSQWCVCAMIIIVVRPNVIAQDSVSHRRLKMPEGGATDVHTQLQMLSHLRTLMQSQQDDNKPPAFSPGQMGMLQQLMKSFGDQLPEDLIEQAANLPPELVSGIASDPQARAAVEQMLKQFSQDGTLPKPGANGVPELPPALRDALRKFQQPGASPGSKDPRPGTESPSRQDINTGIDSVDRMLEKMRDIERKRTEETPSASRSDDNGKSTQSSESRTPKKDEPDTRRPDRRSSPARPSGASMSPEEANERINEELRQKSGEKIADERSRNGSRTTQPFGSRGEPNPKADDRGSLNQNRRPVRSVPDFLRNYEDLTEGLETLSDENRGPAAPRSSTRPRQGNPAENSPSVAESNTPGERARSSTQNGSGVEREAVRKELQQRGFTETLKRLGRDAMREARSAQARSQSPQGAGTSGHADDDGGLSGAFSEAIAGIAKDVIQMIKDGDLKPGQNTSSSENRRGRGSNSTSTFGQLKSTARELFKDAAVPVENTVADAGSGGIASPGFGGGSIAPVFVVLLLAGIGLLMAWKTGLVGPSPGQRTVARRIHPQHIRTREDVVRAFHQMAMKPERDSQDWWTHQRVVDSLVTDAPGKSADAMKLARLYEQARYLPDDVPFTAAEISDAKQALAQCE